MVHLTDPTPVYLRKRYLVVFLIFLGYINLYTLRVNMSTAIVAMTENRSIEHEDGTKTYEQSFDWSSQAKGYALSSFFYGYITTQIAGGVLATRIGGQWVFGLGVLGTAIFTLLTPIMAYQGIGWLIASRVIQGILSGLAYPAINSIYSKYSPPIERSRIVSYGVSGIYCGTIIANLLSGWIGDNLGWEWIFYIFGIATLVWYVFWYFGIKDGPETDNFMKKTERDFILGSLKTQHVEHVKGKYPWKEMFTSMPVLAIAISHFCYNWGYYTMLTQLPMYMRDILNFDLTSSGILSALPYITQTVFVYITGFFADWVQEKGWLNTTQVRRTFNSIGLCSQAAFLIVAAFASNTIVIIACISLSVGIGAFSMSGWLANTLDVAPQFSGIILGISNTLATISGIVSPIATGYIATTPNAAEYRIVFSITCGIYIFGMIFYLIFASAEMQPWAVVETRNDTENPDAKKEIEGREKKTDL